MANFLLKNVLWIRKLRSVVNKKIYDLDLKVYSHLMKYLRRTFGEYNRVLPTIAGLTRSIILCTSESFTQSMRLPMSWIDYSNERNDHSGNSPEWRRFFKKYRWLYGEF